MTDSAILRFNRDLLFELETDGTPEGSIVKAPFSGTIPGGGPILSFDSTVETPIPLIVHINPIQEGSGDPSPSNVRPISGWDSVEVGVSGGNLWDEEWEVGSIDPTNGATVTSTTQIRSKNYIPVKPNSTVYLYCAVGGTFNYRLYRADKSYIKGTYYGANQTLTIPDDCYYLRFVMGGTYGATYNHDISINYPSTDHAYHEFVGNSTITTNLPQTVYGGVLDVVSGKLTAFPYYSAYNGETLSGEWICDRAVYSQGTTPPTGSQVVDMSGAGTELTTIPTEIKTLIGKNNIWSNSGDVYTIITTVNVTYKVTGGGEDVQQFNKIRRSLLLYQNGGIADEHRNISGERDKIIPHGPAVLKEE